MITDKHSTNSQFHIFCGIVLMILFSLTPLRAQGVLYDPVADDTLPQLPLYGGIKGSSALPSTFSLRDYCPPPSNQHSTNACVSFASGYGALSVYYAKKNGWTKAMVAQNAFSAAYVFKQMNKEGGLTTVPAVFKFMTEHGVCGVNTFPNSLITEPIKQTLILKAQKEAERNKNFGLAVHLIGKTAPKIKETLAAGFPVIFTAVIDKIFQKFKTDIWEPLSQGEERHAMLIVGYDDKYFDVMNSYGTGWGKEGFIKLKQSDIDAVIKVAYILAPASKGIGVEDLTTTPINPNEREEIGVFQLSNTTKTFDGRDTSLFEPTEVAYNTSRRVYETVRPYWQTDKIFQLTASSIPAGKHLYIFSINALDSLNIHWPPDARWRETDAHTAAYYAPNFAKKPVSSVILSKETVLTIPSPEEGLQIKNVGEDQLIVLIADRTIHNFKERLDTFKVAKGTVFNRLKNSFGDAFVPESELFYLPNGLTIDRRVYWTKGWIVPMILAISAK